MAKMKLQPCISTTSVSSDLVLDTANMTSIVGKYVGFIDDRNRVQVFNRDCNEKVVTIKTGYARPTAPFGGWIPNSIVLRNTPKKVYCFVTFTSNQQIASSVEEFGVYSFDKNNEECVAIKVMNGTVPKSSQPSFAVINEGTEKIRVLYFSEFGTSFQQEYKDYLIADPTNVVSRTVSYPVVPGEIQRVTSHAMTADGKHVAFVRSKQMLGSTSYGLLVNLVSTDPPNNDELTIFTEEKIQSIDVHKTDVYIAATDNNGVNLTLAANGNAMTAITTSLSFERDLNIQGPITQGSEYTDLKYSNKALYVAIGASAQSTGAKPVAAVYKYPSGDFSKKEQLDRIVNTGGANSNSFGLAVSKFGDLAFSTADSPLKKANTCNCATEPVTVCGAIYASMYKYTDGSCKACSCKSNDSCNTSPRKDDSHRDVRARSRVYGFRVPQHYGFQH